MAPRETENNAYAKFWRDKQRTLWYVMVFLEWSIGATHAHYAWFTKTYGLYPSYDVLQVPTLLGVVASVCTQPQTFSRRFLKQIYPKYICDIVGVRKKNPQLSDLICLNL